MTLPTKAEDRKAVPIATGVVDYFPDAIAAVAAVSQVGGQQHNPGKPLFWDRSKSGDEADALMRHFLERGELDTDGVRHSAKVAWRALALLQKEIEGEQTEISMQILSIAAVHPPLLDRRAGSGWPTDWRCRNTHTGFARRYASRGRRHDDKPWMEKSWA